MKKRLYSAGDITRRLRITYRELYYLFEARLLKRSNYEMLGGNRIFRKSDIKKIKKALSKIK